jgi:hypothetical protein
MIIGPSLMRGAKATGSVRFQPFLIVCEIINAWNGPGCAAAANAYVIPKII